MFRYFVISDEQYIESKYTEYERYSEFFYVHPSEGGGQWQVCLPLLRGKHTCQILALMC